MAHGRLWPSAPCQCFSPGGIQTTSPGLNLLDWPTFTLRPAAAGGDDQGLAEWMCAATQYARPVRRSPEALQHGPDQAGYTADRYGQYR